MDAEIPEHGVGFPAAEQHDGVAVDVGTKEGSGSAWTERASADEVGVDSSDLLRAFSSVSEGCGDEAGFDGVPFTFFGVRVVEHVEWSGRWSVMCA